MQDLTLEAFAKLCPIDLALEMLDTDANRKRLLLHLHSPPGKHVERISRAVPDSQDQCIARDRNRILIRVG